MSKSLRFLPLLHILGISFLLFAGCELFSGVPAKDLMDKIDEDIKRQKAAKVEVTVAYPLDWGFSTQYGTNKCGDVRQGYPFNVDFAPQPDYALLEWRAYATADLQADWLIWLEDPEKYFDTDNKAQQITGVILPVVDQGSGTGQVTINTTDPVTLIPFSRCQPRVTGSVPDSSTLYYGRSRPIRITFAAPLDPSTVVFGTNTISITKQAIDDSGVARGIDQPIDDTPGFTQYYEIDQTALAGDSKTIIINPYSDTGGPPSNSQITLRLGSGLKTSTGGSWKTDESFSVVWRTRQNTCFVGTWQAKYKKADDGTRNIYLQWTQGGDATAQIRYRKNGDVDYQTIDIPPEAFSDTDNAFEWTIPNLTDPCFDASALAANPGVGYEIRIDLDSNGELYPMEDGEEIYIWNIPDMSVTSDNPASAVTTQETFESMMLNNPDIIYVLDKDFSVKSNQINPLGKGSANAFKGTFYGMGHTITIDNGLMAFMTNTQYIGLFGYTDGATIQDLNVVYNQPNVYQNSSLSADIYAGGLIGYASGITGSTTIANCTVMSGNAGGTVLQNSGSSAFNVYLGGIAGYLDSNTTLENCNESLDLKIEKTNSGDIYIGGLAGYSSSVMNSSLVSGNISVSQGTGRLFTGGLAGYQETNAISDCYAITTITADSASTDPGGVSTGGLAGYLKGNTAGITRSFARNTTSVTGSAAGIYSGGIAGFAESAVINNSVLLGGSLSAANTGANNVSRIVGGINSASLSGNSARYSTVLIPAREPDSNASGLDGLNVTTTSTSSSAFWTDMGYNVPVWILNPANLFSTSGANDQAGYPLLSGTDNPEIQWETIQKLSITSSVTPDSAKGSIEGLTQAEPGVDITLTADPVAGYSVTGFSVQGPGGAAGPALTGSGNFRSFVMPNYNVTANVEILPNNYAILKEYKNQIGGSFTVTSNSGADDISSALTDDIIHITPAALQGWMVSSITANQGVTVSVTAGSHGEVTDGSFTMPGLPSGSQLTITVDFEKITHPVNVDIDTSQGTAAANVTQAALGDTVTIAVTPKDGYKIKTVTTSPDMTVSLTTGTGPNNEYGSRTASFNMLGFPFDTTIDVAVVFDAIPNDISSYIMPDSPDAAALNAVATVTLTSGGLPVTQAKIGDVVTITANPNNTQNFNNEEWRVKGMKAIVTQPSTGSVEMPVTWSVNNPGTGTFTMGGYVYGSEVNFVVEFERIYAINCSVDPSNSGTLTVTKATPDQTRAAAGEAVTVTAAPDTGWDISGWTFDPQPSDLSGSDTSVSRRFSMPEGGISITAALKKHSYNIFSTVSGRGGTISSIQVGTPPVTQSNANYGQAITVNVVPISGYQVDDVKVV
ncbi:MAG: hypothetical protein FWF29_06300, partial [Treponema sp.]|nr:hypothetical protein [Treponema sp.]